ncbi:M23 family metallopeptidase [Sphingomonas sanguinis]|uniref:M23 family metallopeptidase n=1 Tax=Sphingomonas sp. LC-1 TaxID=3110957 RepID=UPI0021BAA31A|nr:M23 family metallopeptidase [Sphingomonas sp. LC-1]MCT8000699.1 M23 family metallopeptidase [Sphingomonas sp. LC-1]
MLALIVIGVGGFMSMLSFGSGDVVVPEVAAPEKQAAAGSAAALAMPIADYPVASLRQDWGDPREGGARKHQGLDLMAPAGTPVVAALPGTIEKLFDSDRGGHTLYIRSLDRRWSLYYAHLQGYAADIAEGQRVRQGQVVGYVGDSGNAGAGNTHLHFGVSWMRAGDAWYQGEPVDPYPLLAGKTASS